MKHMKTQLREVSAVRTVGFADAVIDLGTHSVCGNQVSYSTQQVRKVLKGEHKSLKLLMTIAACRPDLFGLRFVHPEVKAWYAEKKGAKQ